MNVYKVVIHHKHGVIVGIEYFDTKTGYQEIFGTIRIKSASRKTIDFDQKVLALQVYHAIVTLLETE